MAPSSRISGKRRRARNIMIYTAWGIEERPDTLIEGVGPPSFANGTVIEPDAKLIWTIEASCWDEAMYEYYKLQGWGEYVPKCLGCELDMPIKMANHTRDEAGHEGICCDCFDESMGMPTKYRNRPRPDGKIVVEETEERVQRRREAIKRRKARAKKNKEK